jgi:hypothetical protein
MYSRPLFGGNMQGAGVWEDMNAWGKQNGANFHKTLNEFAIHNNKMLFGGSATTATINMFLLEQQIDDLKNYRRIINSRRKYGNAAERDIIHQDVLIISDLIRKLEQKKRGYSTYQLEHQIASLTDFLRSRGYHMVTVVETRGAFHLLPLPADIVDEPPPNYTMVANPGVAQVTNPRYIRGGALNFRNPFRRRAPVAPVRRVDTPADRARRAAAAGARQGLPLNLPPPPPPPEIEEVNIPELDTRFELITTTTPRGTPEGAPVLAPRGVPYNAIRASSVVENESDFTPRGTNLLPQAQGFIPYSRTISSINDEVNHYTEVVASGERLIGQLRAELERNPSRRVRDQYQETGVELTRARLKLAQLTNMQNAGRGNEMIYIDTSFNFPQGYTPPGGFPDDDPLLGAGMYIQTEDPMAKYA